MARYSATLRDQNEAPISGALVAVINSATGASATLTNDDSSSEDNPFTTDAFGGVVFNADGAFYDLEYHYGGRLVRKDYGVPVFGSGTGPASTLIGFDASGKFEYLPVADFQGPEGPPAGNAAAVSTRTALAAILAPINNQIAYLSEAGREGWFKFNTANLSANVTADPGQGIYVPPASGTSGAAGAWVRITAAGFVNARWFGALGDGATNDTTAVQRAINYAASLAVAKLFFPAGVYLVTNLAVPTFNNLTMRALEFCGVAQPGTLYGTVPSGSAVVNTAGSIIKSTATSGAILAVTPNGGGFSLYNTVIRDLTFRSYDNPQVTALDMSWSSQLECYNVQVDTGLYNPGASLPTHSTVWGLITPKIANGGLTYLHNVSIEGHYWGIDVNEHTYGDYININSCLWGLIFETANDSSLFGRVCIQLTPHCVAVSGSCRFDIQQLMIEDLSDTQLGTGMAWMMPVEHIRDFGSAALASIRLELAKGDVGPVDLTHLRKTNGLNISVSRVGDAPNPSGSHFITQPTVTNNTLTTLSWAGSAGDIGLVRNVGSSFTASIAGTTMTVTASASGRISVGDTINGSGVTGGTVVTAFLNGSGGLGTYQVNNSQTVASEAMTISADLTKLICKVAGVYELDFSGAWVANATGIRQLAMYVNGSPIDLAAAPAMASPYETPLRLKALWILAVGDVVTIAGLQTSGGDLILQQNNYSGKMRFRRVGANWP